MPNKKVPIEEVKKRLFEIHGTKISILENTYRGIKYPATFNHIDHGSWEASVNSVLKGSTHKIAALIDQKLTQSEAEDRLRNMRGNKVKIVWNSYIDLNTPAKFIHDTEGEFEALPITMFYRPKMTDGDKALSKEARRLKGLNEIKDRLLNMFDGQVAIVDDSFLSMKSPATFIHSTYGSWIGMPYCVVGRGNLSRKMESEKQKYTQSELEEKLKAVHSDIIKIVWESYTNCNTKAKFIHSIYGEFFTTPNSVLAGHGPRVGQPDKMRKTSLERFGVESISQNKEIALKIAKSQAHSTTKVHWKTGEELVCQASWEPKVVDYLNTNKIEYLWQPKVFVTPVLTQGGRNSTYRPDLFLINENKWIEIKGWFRDDAKLKWDWFQSEYPNSELWDKKKLKEMGIL